MGPIHVNLAGDAVVGHCQRAKEWDLEQWNGYYIIAVPPILPSKHVPSLPYRQAAGPAEASLSLSGFGEGLSERTGKFGDVMSVEVWREPID